ncbi:hypothetical protein CRM22_006760 [Opisthorchis felineus]|uniref:MD-2-related lipid-recognition domain-containing protein n=1 Tax=Opisthorchis felineus TaxID=147828 RepID=A0A4S2LRU0_OPIFE|nr:hypothetical protein CRM22_006760 [Opisthorchis felineus]
MGVDFMVLFITTNILFVSARVLDYVDCGSTVQVTSVSMEPCILIPCELIKASRTTIRIQFTTDENVGSAGDAGFYGIFEEMTFPFMVWEPQFCGDLQQGCPLRPGRSYVYRKDVYTSPAYPDIQLTGRWVLKNNAGEPMVCVEFPIQIVR